MEQKAMQLAHKIVLNQRTSLTVTGVTEVMRFDDESVVLRTELGTLIVQGTQLKLKTLATEGGQVTVEGSVASLVYEEPKDKGGWLHRLLG